MSLNDYFVMSIDNALLANNTGGDDPVSRLLM